MRNCYICDAAIPGAGFRRTVRTGTSNRIYFGRRVSTSRGEQRGLRTVCATCADRIDAQARFTARLAGFAVLVFVGLVIFGGATKNSSPSNTYQANPVTPRGQTSVALYPATTEAMPSPTSVPSTAILGTAASSVGAVPPTNGANQSGLSDGHSVPIAGGSVQVSTSMAPALHPAWRHVTSGGIQWSLRQLPEGMHLFIDLANRQVATVDVSPEFLKLDLNSMNTRVDWMKSMISQRWPQRSASYVYRNGEVTPGGR
jgi:hypothetical protein